VTGLWSRIAYGGKANATANVASFVLGVWNTDWSQAHVGRFQPHREGEFQKSAKLRRRMRGLKPAKRLVETTFKL